jgi:hypothetical protein
MAAYKLLKQLVGAPGFEPGPPAPKCRRATQNNPPAFSVAAEKELSRDGNMWPAVRACPRMFPGWGTKVGTHFDAEANHRGQPHERTPTK